MSIKSTFPLRKLLKRTVRTNTTLNVESQTHQLLQFFLLQTMQMKEVEK